MGAGIDERADRIKQLIAERRYEEGVHACRHALMVDPGSLDVRLLLGEALLALQRYPEVQHEMTSLARREPGEPSVYRILGEAYLRDHRPQPAAEVLGTALDLDPQDLVSHDLLREAEEMLRPGLAVDPQPTARFSGSPWDDEPLELPMDPGAEGAYGPPSEPRIPSSIPAPPTRIGQQPTPSEDEGDPIGNPPTRLALDPMAASRPSSGSGFHLEPLDGDTVAIPTQQELEEEDDDDFDWQPTRARAPHPLSQRPARPDSPSRPGGAVPHEAVLPEEVLPEEAASPEQGLSHEAVLPESDEYVPPAMPALTPAPATPLKDSMPRFAGVGQAPVLPELEPPQARSRRSDPGGGPAWQSASQPGRAHSNRSGARPPSRPASRRRRQRSVAPLLGGTLLGLLAVAVAFGANIYIQRRATSKIRAAALTAGDTGRPEDLLAVVNLLNTYGSRDAHRRALRARVLATLVWEHGERRASEVEALLSRELSAYTDGRIARAQLRLARGEPEGALQMLDGLTAQGDQIPEAYRARSQATAAVGRLDDALSAAEAAVSQRPQAARHRAQLALMRHRTGDSAGALEVLDQTPDHPSSPAVRVTRARVLLESGSDPERAAREAASVVEAQAGVATPAQLAWAHLVLSVTAADQADEEVALREARVAARTPPQSDPFFRMLLISTLLRSGAASDANLQLRHLRGAAVEPHALALLTAEVALAVGDLHKAEGALTRASEGAARTVLQAQLRRAQGRINEARRLLRGVLTEPGSPGRRAHILLGAIELRHGNSARAVELLEQVRPGAADDPELVPLIAEAYLREGRPADASAALSAALARRPDAVELIAAQGAVQMQQGSYRSAFESYQRAVRARSEDVRLQLDYGEAARLAGERDEARRAFDTALRLRPRDPQARLALVAIELSLGRLSDAERHLDELGDRAPVPAGRERGRILVLRGAGQRGIGVLLPIADRHPDPMILLRLGMLHVQAERDAEAQRIFDRVLLADPTQPLALLERGQLDLRRGALSAAARLIEQAQRQGERRGEASNPMFQARLAVAMGRLSFEQGDFGEAARRARQALQKVDQFGPAHLLLADVQKADGSDPTPELRLAISGVMPPPEAVGRLVRRLGRQAEDRCALAERYLSAAPNGYDGRRVRALASDCR